MWVGDRCDDGWRVEMKAGVELRGLDKLIKQMERMEGGERMLAQAMHAEATVVLNESKKIVPVATGNLRASGRVERPVTGNGRASVAITYGGAAAPYALFVHEIPPNSGGRWGTGMTHAAGKSYKYLEIPVMAHKKKFVDGVRARIDQMLNGK
jgi:hypothetical protein